MEGSMIHIGQKDMLGKILNLILIPLLVLMFSTFPAWAQAPDEEIAALKAQVQQLLKRIEALEQEQAKTKEVVAKQQEDVAKKVEPSVVMDKLLSKLKLKGRWAAGYFDSGKAGSYPSGSFEVPDAKLQFTFEPDEVNKIVMRMNLNNATFNSVDYSYIDTNLTKLFNLTLPLSSRIGRMKLEFGEETLWNNPIEGVLPSNSAINADGKDEGLQLSGKLGKAKPINYAVSVTNGTSGTGSDTSSAKAFTGKLFYNIINPLYISASYYNSGSMKSSSAEMSIAGLTSRPSNAARWSREIWEVDLRYDFKKGKIFNPPAFSDSKAIVQLAYGGFSDGVSATAALGSSARRHGKYGFVEGTYNFTQKFYLAGRASIIDLDGDALASLNNITCNEYQRYSLGGGYRLTGNTILKLGYDWNRESGSGVDEADNNLLSAVVASQF